MILSKAYHGRTLILIKDNKLLIQIGNFLSHILYISVRQLTKK